jgi:hypothetical protein
MRQVKVQKAKVTRGKCMKAKIFGLALSAMMLFALCFSAQAQQPKKVPRIG